jgi:hypothetical protein
MQSYYHRFLGYRSSPKRMCPLRGTESRNRANSGQKCNSLTTIVIMQTEINSSLPPPNSGNLGMIACKPTVGNRLIRSILARNPTAHREHQRSPASTGPKPPSSQATQSSHIPRAFDK